MNLVRVEKCRHQRRAPYLAHERMDAVRQLAYAVEDVHAAGVTHNDIKADNCLLEAPMETSNSQIWSRRDSERQQADGWEHLLAHDF